MFQVMAVPEHMYSTYTGTYTQSNPAALHNGVHTQVHTQWCAYSWGTHGFPEPGTKPRACPLGQLNLKTCVGMLCFLSRVQANPSPAPNEREDCNLKGKLKCI